MLWLWFLTATSASQQLRFRVYGHDVLCETRHRLTHASCEVALAEGVLCVGPGVLGGRYMCSCCNIRTRNSVKCRHKAAQPVSSVLGTCHFELTCVLRHEGFGGIHPTVAIGAHQKNMVSLCAVSFCRIIWNTLLQPRAVRRALDEANMSMNDIDGIAFTRGPGMSIPSCDIPY